MSHVDVKSFLNDYIKDVKNIDNFRFPGSEELLSLAERLLNKNENIESFYEKLLKIDCDRTHPSYFPTRNHVVLHYLNNCPLWVLGNFVHEHKTEVEEYLSIPKTEDQVRESSEIQSQ